MKGIKRTGGKYMETKLNFLSLTTDLVFKKLMSIPKYAEDFVNAYLLYCGSPLRVKSVEVTPQKFLQSDNVNHHDYYLDVFIVLSNNEMYNIELYNYFGTTQLKKSVTYASWLYSHQLKKQESFNNSHKVTSINLITNKFLENNSFLNSYQFRNQFTSKILLNDLIDVVLIRLDKTPDKEYTKRKQRLNQWCRFILANSYEEMEEVAEGDELFMSSIEVVKDFCNDPEFNHFRMHDDSKIIDACAMAKDEGKIEGKTNERVKMIQAFGKSLSCEKIAKILNMPVKEVKRYMNTVL